MHHIGKSNNGVERRPKFMAHIREEYRLCPACLCGLPYGEVALLFGLFYRCDIGSNAAIPLKDFVRIEERDAADPPPLLAASFVNYKVVEISERSPRQ